GGLFGRFRGRGGRGRNRDEGGEGLHDRERQVFGEEAVLRAGADAGAGACSVGDRDVLPAPADRAARGEHLLQVRIALGLAFGGGIGDVGDRAATPGGLDHPAVVPERRVDRFEQRPVLVRRGDQLPGTAVG